MHKEKAGLDTEQGKVGLVKQFSDPHKSELGESSQQESVGGAEGVGMGLGHRGSEGPLSKVVNNRIRAIKKKLRKIDAIEQFVKEGKEINEDQASTLGHKQELLAAANELEHMHSVLEEAKQQEMELLKSNLIQDLKDQVRLEVEQESQSNQLVSQQADKLERGEESVNVEDEKGSKDEAPGKDEDDERNLQQREESIEEKQGDLQGNEVEKEEQNGVVEQAQDKDADNCENRDNLVQQIVDSILPILYFSQLFQPQNWTSDFERASYMSYDAAEAEDKNGSQVSQLSKDDIDNIVRVARLMTTRSHTDFNSHQEAMEICRTNMLAWVNGEEAAETRGFSFDSVKKQLQRIMNSKYYTIKPQYIVDEGARMAVMQTSTFPMNKSLSVDETQVPDPPVSQSQPESNKVKSALSEMPNGLVKPEIADSGSIASQISGVPSAALDIAQQPSTSVNTTNTTPATSTVAAPGEPPSGITISATPPSAPAQQQQLQPPKHQPQQQQHQHHQQHQFVQPAPPPLPPAHPMYHVPMQQYPPPPYQMMFPQMANGMPDPQQQYMPPYPMPPMPMPGHDPTLPPPNPDMHAYALPPHGAIYPPGYQHQIMPPNMYRQNNRQGYRQGNNRRQNRGYQNSNNNRSNRQRYQSNSSYNHNNSNFSNGMSNGNANTTNQSPPILSGRGSYDSSSTKSDQTQKRNVYQKQQYNNNNSSYQSEGSMLDNQPPPPPRPPPIIYSQQQSQPIQQQQSTELSPKQSPQQQQQQQQQIEVQQQQQQQENDQQTLQTEIQQQTVDSK